MARASGAVARKTAASPTGPSRGTSSRDARALGDAPPAWDQSCADCLQASLQVDPRQRETRSGPHPCLSRRADGVPYKKRAGVGFPRGIAPQTRGRMGGVAHRRRQPQRLDLRYKSQPSIYISYPRRILVLVSSQRAWQWDGRLTVPELGTTLNGTGSKGLRAGCEDVRLGRRDPSPNNVDPIGPYRTQPVSLSYQDDFILLCDHGRYQILCSLYRGLSQAALAPRPNLSNDMIMADPTHVLPLGL